jgi:hypothetical protein
MKSSMIFADEGGEGIDSFICGLHLRSIVGLERATIKHLVLNLKSVGKEYTTLIARAVAPTLSSLAILCGGQDSSECYDALTLFFERCDGIRNLRLEDFDFGDHPASISSVLNRLNQLDLIDCQGDIRMFVENTPIPNLRLMYYESNREAEEEEDIISSIVSSYRTLCSMNLSAKFESSDSLLKVVECCRCIERLVFSPRGNFLGLERPDILAITSLPHLCHLELYCRIAEDAYSSLTRCRRLKDLIVSSLRDDTVLPEIGKNLLILDLFIPSKEVISGIVEYCPNLHYLYLEVMGELKDDDLEELKHSLMEGLKKLSKLKVNGMTVRLGTDWEGYPESR